MPKSWPDKQRTLIFIVLIIGVFALIAGTILSPPRQEDLIPLLSLAFFILLLEIVPLYLFSNKFSLIHIIVFAAGCLYGTGVAVWGSLLGILAAIIILSTFPSRMRRFIRNYTPIFPRGLIDYVLSSFSLVISLSVFGLSRGIDINYPYSNQAWLSIFGTGILFVLIHSILYFPIVKGLTQNQLQWNQWDALVLISIEVILIFLGFISLLIYPLVGESTIIILGVLVFALGLLLYYLAEPRKNLERRLQELSTLEEVSRILTSDIELENLLGSIQIQVTKLLDVDNFYVALIDPIDHQIWYPLAVKEGERQIWQRRPQTDRLTDRVILEGKPILIANDARQQLSKIGLPVGENAPYAWIGVPLITSEQTIGCLALFSMNPQSEFTQEDLNLLSILSGQTSVAIEIALHNALLSSDITIGHDRLTKILNSVNEGLILIDTSGKVTLANEAVTNISGIQRDEFIGRTLAELPINVLEGIGISNQQIEQYMDYYSGNTDRHSEKITYKLKDNTQEKFIERSFIRVHDGNHSIIGLILTLRDVTDEHQLKQTQELISETLVHDLRSPLSSIISALDVIRDAQAAGDPAGILEPSIQIAQRSSKRMLAMVESIMEITRMESGKIDLSLAKFDMCVLVQETISEFQILARDYEVGLKYICDEDIPLVRLDEDKIQRVLHNLIENALKFTPGGEEVIVKLSCPDPKIISINILDRGPGIPEQYLDQIFDRFFQVPGSSSRKRGTGLGLTYCRLVIEAHNGRIRVENRPDGGSEFVVTLPTTKAEKEEIK